MPTVKKSTIKKTAKIKVKSKLAKAVKKRTKAPAKVKKAPKRKRVAVSAVKKEAAKPASPVKPISVSPDDELKPQAAADFINPQTLPTPLDNKHLTEPADSLGEIETKKNLSTVEQSEAESSLTETKTVLDEIKDGIKFEPKEQPVAVDETESGDDKDYDEDKEQAPIAAENGSDTPKRASLSLYRRIAFSFIFFTFALLVVVFYFSFVKVSIILIPNQERVSNNLIIDIYDAAGGADAADRAIIGVVKEVEVENMKSYSASGEEAVAEEAVGRATIINNYDRSQPLVATTRLLTPDNKLFRISKTVNVPAGGSVDVEIYADNPGPDMAISPTKFTIPGLWAGLQDKIYAQNKEPIKYNQKTKKYIKQYDIDQAVRSLKEELVAKAKIEIGDSYKNYDQVLYDIDDNSVKIEMDGKVGEERDEFSVTIKTKVAVIAFNEESVSKLSKGKLISSLPANKELLWFDENKIVYVLNSHDTRQGTATVNAFFEARAVLSDEADIIDKSKLLGLNKDQLSVYLKSLPEIASFEINFTPAFISKIAFVNKVPRLPGRIEIEIKK